MSIYIIRPQATSVARSLKLQSRKFTSESRPGQVAEVVDFWQEDPVHREIEHWLEDAENVSKHPTYSGITGAAIVEMSDEEAVRMRRELPNALILRDQPIELIQPERNLWASKDKITAADLWHLEAFALGVGEAIALNKARQQGFTGTGKNITVAVLDTGIDNALILEKYNKQITVGRLFDALLSTCQDLKQQSNRQGQGLIQVTAAL